MYLKNLHGNYFNWGAQLTQMSKLFDRLSKVDEAISKISTYISNLPSEIVSTERALGRVLAEDIVSPTDLPPYDRVAFDGYAVRSESTFGASPDNPIVLRVIGSSSPGEECGFEIESMEAVEVATGAPLPKGADSVVPLEYSRRVGEYVEILKQVAPGANVDRAGSDIRKGEVLIKKGTFLGPFEILAISSLNITQVRVVRKPRVCIIASGDELVELGSELKRGKVVNSNVFGIRAIIGELAETRYLGIARDEPDSIKRLIGACDDCDIILTIAGSSVGSKDYLYDVIKSMGGEILVRGLSIMPGKPTVLATLGGKLLVGIPGYPVSAMVATSEVLLPIIQRLLGIRGVEVKARVRAKLSQRVPSSPGVRHYVRVKLNKRGDSYIATPVRIGGAGIVSSLLRSDGFLVVPEEVEGYEEGDEVDVIVYKRWLDLEEGLQTS
jgi:molybdopterin molybdotransferase